MSCLIVDYGMGNLRSIQHKLKKIGLECGISERAEEVLSAEALILPGVGHFARGMANLRERGLVEALNRKVLQERTPVMGICLGMQLFSNWSEEGNAEGLGWIQAETRRFHFSDSVSSLRIPHIGWNTLVWKQDSPLAAGIEPEQRFYFVHSYHVCCREPGDVLTTTIYGYEFVSSIHRGNIFGTQFHPEKSHGRGLRILSNFMALAGGR